ncbi:uncharacterized protein MAM_07406 [Metarhizium album ARSEF 1941]|uniref:Uncharacterized protein n=1 Tax=Metarhizium album (strain ARSEF 1941) TaxID=1081103 RepID=A0A0B2WP97_METAS|nr:uncharacterized protein MAM_07406 [Metarhizium album ARSEF 1941]KHN94810.1 hypothetical protein MAM_07406 [Metarhizium album ARSEF 1941]
MFCPDGCPCGQLVDLFDCMPGPLHFGGNHYYGPSYHHHDYRYPVRQRLRRSSYHETYIFGGGSGGGGGGGGGGGERHTMNIVDMTPNSLSNDRGHFYKITFPLQWSARDLLARLTSNSRDYTVLVQGPFGFNFELTDGMDLKQYLGPCSTMEIAKKQQPKNNIKHIEM